MTETTISGEPLSETAKLNLERIRAIARTRYHQVEEEVAEERRHKRAGVHVMTAEEKAAFLASRPDLG